MTRITIPDGADPLMHLWTAMVPKLAIPAAKFTAAVYAECSLSLREFEAARTQVAQINDCAVCLSFRSGRDADKYKGDEDQPDEDFYAHVGTEWDGFSVREQLSAEFARRFALEHLDMDDAFWSRMHESFSDDEIVELGLCVGSWIAFGRLQRILGVDACRVPQI